jgi:hypothetical protein
MQQEQPDLPIINSLTGRRIFNVYVPDVTMAQAKEIKAHVLKFVLPDKVQFIDALQIESPLAALLPSMGSSQLGYAFMYDPSVMNMVTFYITSVHSNVEFPWMSQPNIDALITYIPLLCMPLSATVHSGLPLLHVRLNPLGAYASFESELAQAGYTVVNTKVYRRDEAIKSLAKIFPHAVNKPPSSPTTPDAVG